MITINLLPVRETRKKESERKNVFILGSVLAGTLVVIVAVHVTISRKIGSVRNQIQSTQARLAA
jgi:Tfp pilus assembly protein PilN